MANRNSSKIQGNSGVIYEMAVRAKLILRLMLDVKVNIFLKLIPVAGVIYVISPFDFPGPFDDIAVFLFCMYLFIESCPKNIVKEHLDRIHGVSTSNQPSTDDDIIDVEYKNLDDPHNS